MLLSLAPAYASAQTVRQIEFPVGGPNSFSSDFGAPRGGGTRSHMGNDIIAAKMTPLLSAIDGKVEYLVSPEASWGYEIALVDSDGYQYLYYHVNNDNPGTDDDKGGESNAYAAGLARGQSVVKGQQIGWVGDSGNAENTVPHLHFEIHDPNYIAIDPYPSLMAATGAFRNSNTMVGITPDTRSLLEHAVDGRPDDVFKSILEQGAEGAEVRELQITLKVIGLLDADSITGYFGPKTRAAVIEFQKRQSIDPIGIVGVKTREVLNRGINSGVLVEYKPFYNAAEERAILIQRLLAQIAILQARLKAITGQDYVPVQVNM